MNLGAIVTQAMPMFREMAESLMIDTATVSTTSLALDQTTGAEVTTLTQVYAGRCKVQSADLQASSPEAVGATLTVQSSRVDFPAASFAPAVGQVVTITASVLDPNLVGRKFRVAALLHKTAATAYRLAVEETT